jgi:hypothetical protein
LPLSGEDLVGHLKGAAEDHLCGPLTDQALRTEELNAIAGRVERYALTAAGVRLSAVPQGAVS